MDRGLHYLLNLTPNGVTPLITVDSYFGYFTGMLLGFGLVFEVPLLIVMLNVVGILTHERFRKWRRLIIFGSSCSRAWSTRAPTRGPCCCWAGWPCC